jgi:transcription elongation factor Elf1
MRVPIEFCVGTCPTCGAKIDLKEAPGREVETVDISCGRCGCNLEFRSAEFWKAFDQAVRGFETTLCAGHAFVQTKSRAA